MNKYYLQQNCRENAPIQAGPYKVQFEPVSFHAGSWFGVFYTDDTKVQEELDKVVAARKAGVSEITEEDFGIWAKKKGSQQTHTWVVSESVLDQRPSPQPEKSVSSADSATDTPESNLEKEDTQAEEHEIEELMETRERDEPTTENHVSSQAALAEALGISINKMRDLAKLEGNPGKAGEGYDISAWQKFLKEQG
jgi:hypothetical protein